MPSRPVGQYMTARAETARAYYRAIDDDEYDRLRDVLASTFVQERPDLTLEGPDRFVRFMREERPKTDTTHAVDAMYENGSEVAVRGRLLSGEEYLFGFVDVFAFEGGEIALLRTYTQ